MADDRLIVALDVHSLEAEKRLVTELREAVSYYKVGMELFYSVGAPAVTYLKEQGKKVFLDLKLHDIPNTVGGGLASLLGLGADMLNVHAGGGAAMLRQGLISLSEAAAKLKRPRPKLIAITILTSMSEDDWQGLGYTVPIAEQVARLAKLTEDAGLDGVVASPREAALIRKETRKDFLIVTPGVRPLGAAAGDQSRIATPQTALRQGATHLVIGRPIIAAASPREAAENILREMNGA
ncbi:MAG: orotidine-5'-phosphate decarboxylase [Selenomonadaceae bacterium]|nr:orotidine-5'-phosphate decarboxylase [Selenomonadaceae bacterium]